MPTKQKPTWRPGQHDVYVVRDKPEGWFKIGMTGEDLEKYRKRLCYLWARSDDGIEICCSWLFEDFWAAWYVEQTAIAFCDRFEFERVRSADWFAIDKPTMSVVVELIDLLAYPIRKWEQEKCQLKCLPPFLHPWGKALRRETERTARNLYRDDYAKLIPRQSLHCPD